MRHNIGHPIVHTSYNKFLAKSKTTIKKCSGLFKIFFQAKVERFFNVSTLSSLISVEVQINVELDFFFIYEGEERGVGTFFSFVY